jgi:integrase
MKMRRLYVAPLPSQLVSALRELQKLTGRHCYLFLGIGLKNEVIRENTINLVFSKIGYKGRMVGHGTRHTASTLLRDHGWEKDHVETQLSHLEGGHRRRLQPRKISSTTSRDNAVVCGLPRRAKNRYVSCPAGKFCPPGQCSASSLGAHPTATQWN